MPTVKSLNLILLLPSRKLSLLFPTKYVCPNHLTNITVSMLKLFLYMKNFLMLLKREKSVLRTILNKELTYLLLNSIGIRMRLLRSGPLVLITPEETSLLKRLQEFNT